MSAWPAMGLLWVAWVVSWFVASFWTNRTASRPGMGREWGYRLVTAAGVIALLMSGRHLGRPSVPAFVIWALVFAEFCGFAFAWWARLHLGRLWSSSVTRKDDHRVVDTGPYAIVRHPIYTGLLVAVFAVAVAEGRIGAFAGAGLMTLGFWMKARLEENFLRGELGAEAYDAYRRRVPMLLPFGPKSA